MNLKTKQETISILGSGSFGIALATVLSQRHMVRLWGRDSLALAALAKSGDANNTAARDYSKNERRNYLAGINVDFSKIHLEPNLQHAVEQSDLLLLALPSHAIAQFSSQVAPFLRRAHVIVSLAKGIERNSFQTMTEVIAGALQKQGLAFPAERIVAFSGPSHAEEMALGKPTLAVLACRDSDLGYKLCKVFQTPTLKTYTHSDIISLELAAMMKNVIAIAAGIIAAKDLGINAQAALVTRGLQEMRRYLLFRQATGQEPGALAAPTNTLTVYGLSGVGDLMATCFSDQSRNRRFGKLIALGHSSDEALKEVGQTVEGYYALSTLHAEAMQKKIYMPITQSVYRVVCQGESIETAIGELMHSTDPREFA